MVPKNWGDNNEEQQQEEYEEYIQSCTTMNDKLMSAAQHYISALLHSVQGKRVDHHFQEFCTSRFSDRVAHSV